MYRHILVFNTHFGLQSPVSPSQRALRSHALGRNADPAPVASANISCKGQRLHQAHVNRREMTHMCRSPSQEPKSVASLPVIIRKPSWPVNRVWDIVQIHGDEAVGNVYQASTPRNRNPTQRANRLQEVVQMAIHVLARQGIARVATCTARLPWPERTITVPLPRSPVQLHRCVFRPALDFDLQRGDRELLEGSSHIVLRKQNIQ